MPREKEKGQTLIEYLLAIIFVTLAALSIYKLYYFSLQSYFNRLAKIISLPYP